HQGVARVGQNIRNGRCRRGDVAAVDDLQLPEVVAADYRVGRAGRAVEAVRVGNAGRRGVRGVGGARGGGAALVDIALDALERRDSGGGEDGHEVAREARGAR